MLMNNQDDIEGDDISQQQVNENHERNTSKETFKAIL